MTQSQRFSMEEIVDALSEAVWEKEREPLTSVWVSFWDRITQGGPIPDLPVVEAETG